MDSTRKATVMAGVLFLTGIITGIFSIVPAIDSPDYLMQASANANQVVRGAIFQFTMAAAYVGFAVSLYPVLRKFNESLSLGFVGFRFIAGVFNIIGVIGILVLLALSREFVQAGAPDSSYFQVLGELLRAGRDSVNHVAMILAHSVGGLMLYCLFYQTKLVPRWLSGWGFVGTTLTIGASLLVMFRLIGIITPNYLLLSIPIALQETVFALWLIVKGLNPSALNSVYE